MQTIRRSGNRFRKTERRIHLFLLSILLLLFVSNSILATNLEIKKGTITGNIAENVSNIPLQYAQVAIYNQSDSSLVSGPSQKKTEISVLKIYPLANITWLLNISDIKKKLQMISLLIIRKIRLNSTI